MEQIQLSDHFSYKKLIRFTLAPISTMLFTSIYGIVDGFFVSNFVGSAGFAALNLVYPFIMIIAAIGFMFGSGGSALVSMNLGLGEKKKANEYFSLIVFTVVILGMLLSAIGIVFAPFISESLGATGELKEPAVIYLRINLFGMIFFMLQQMFQTFLIVNEKPKMGFRVTLVAGITNMVLDAILVGALRLGIAGAAWATVTSQIVGGIIPLIYFFLPGEKILRFTRFRFNLVVLLKACGNGISEFLSNIAGSIVGVLFNLQLLHYAGKNGVSAYGVIMYVMFIFVAIYIGFSMGVSPVISYHYGAGNTNELKSLFKKSLVIIVITNIVMMILSELSAGLLVKIFVGYDPELYEMTVHGMRIYSFAFLVMGINIFASALFTALNNGTVSAVLSVSRTLVFEIIFIYTLPRLFGIDGLWLVVDAVELLGLILSIACFMLFKKKYKYL